MSDQHLLPPRQTRPRPLRRLGRWGKTELVRYARLHGSFAVLLFCLVAVLCLTDLVSWPLRFAVTGDLVVHSATMRVVAGLDLEPDLPLDPTKTIRLDQADGTPAMKRSTADAAKGPDAIILSAIHLTPESMLSVNMVQVGRRWRLRLLAGGRGGGATIELQPGVTPRANGSRGDVPDRVTAATDGSRPAPLRLDASLGANPAANSSTLAEDATAWAGQFALEDVRVSQLRFGRESGAPDNAFISTIQRGSVSVVQTGAKYDLGMGSPLTLAGFEGSLISLAIQSDGIHVLFSGYTDSLLLGPAMFPNDKTPTVLDMAYSAQWVRLAAAVAVALLGIWFAERIKRDAPPGAEGSGNGPRA